MKRYTPILAFLLICYTAGVLIGGLVGCVIDVERDNKWQTYGCYSNAALYLVHGDEWPDRGTVMDVIDAYWPDVKYYFGKKKLAECWALQDEGYRVAVVYNGPHGPHARALDHHEDLQYSITRAYWSKGEKRDTP